MISKHHHQICQDAKLKGPEPGLEPGAFHRLTEELPHAMTVLTN